nr:aldo/keto reductase [Cloacibacillus sp. An23]
MNRRDFLKSAAILGAAGSVLGGGKAFAAEAAASAGPVTKALNYNPKMNYRPMGRTGVNVSALGFGLLRLPMLADGKTVDMDQSVAMVRRAIEGGVNYIDTGRVYLGGQSEAVAGKALAGNWRDRVYLTSKAAWWIMERPEDFEKQFDESRRAMNTDVIDFYHIHMIMHRGWREKVIPYKLIDKMMKLKEQGKIRFAGFSFHDRLQLFKEVLDANPGWDFCLIQHNYLDYEYEAGVLGPKYAAANGMGLAVMKPVRTGFLANLPQSMRDALRSTGVTKPDAEWALDYLWDIPEVSVTVSGMGSMADVEANLDYASRAKPDMLTPDEREALGRAIRAYRGTPGHVDCTGCYQCIPCPHNVAVGYIFAYVYNNYLLHRNKERAMFDYTTSMSPIQRGAPASACVDCGECLPKCPQKLDIPKHLKEVAAEFGF